MTISPVSHNTRPESQLLPQEAAAFDLLDKLGIEYDRVSHDAAFNMELCAEVSRVLDVSVCKNLFLCNRQKTAFYLLCMPPDKLLPPELRPGGEPVGAAVLPPGLRHHFGPGQRYGAPCPAAHRPRGL